MCSDLDIFDLFSVPGPVRKPDDKLDQGDVQLELRPGAARATRNGNAGQTPPAPECPTPVHGLEGLARAVGDLPGEFLTEANLTMVAYAVADLLNAAGHPAASAAERWALYEASGRRRSKIEEARARADAVYRTDLEAITDGWEPVYQTKQSRLPWRQPGDPTAPPDEHEP